MVYQYPYTFDLVEDIANSIIRKNFWRLKRTMEWDDVKGEAILQFYRMMQRDLKAGRVIPSKDRFKATYRIALKLHLHTLSNLDTTVKQQVRATDCCGTNDLGFEDLLALEGTFNYDNLDLIDWLEKAPTRVKQVIDLATSMDEEVVIMRKKWLKSRKRDTSNVFFCQALNLDPKQFNVVQEARQYIQTFRTDGE